MGIKHITNSEEKSFFITKNVRFYSDIVKQVPTKRGLGNNRDFRDLGFSNSLQGIRYMELGL